MQKFINDPQSVVDEMLEGFVKAHGDLVAETENERVLKYKEAPVDGKVGIVTGGGSGHKPAFIGYIGKNMADAVAVGEIFTSPPAQMFYDAIKAADSGKGVAILYGNYAGDNMNVQMAMELAEDEGIEIGTSGLAIIAREAEGSMRDAESLMDQVISFSGQKVEEKNITDILGIIDRDIMFESSAAILEGAADRCLEVVEKIYNYGYDIKEFYRALMEQFRNLLISLIAPQKHLLDISENDREETMRLAEMAGEEKLHLLLNFLISREEDLRFTSNPRLILETTMIKLCSLGDFLSFEDLLKKLTSLEKRLVSSAGDDGQTDSERLSDPGAVWSQGDRKSEVKETVGQDRNDKSWDDFLSFLSTKSKAAYSILKEWQVLKLTGETLEIESGNQSFSSGRPIPHQRLLDSFPWFAD